MLQLALRHRPCLQRLVSLPHLKTKLQHRQINHTSKSQGAKSTPSPPKPVLTNGQVAIIAGSVILALMKVHQWHSTPRPEAEKQQEDNQDTSMLSGIIEPKLPSAIVPDTNTNNAMTQSKFEDYVFPKSLSTSTAEVVHLEVGTGHRGLTGTRTLSDVLLPAEKCEELFDPESYRQKSVRFEREGNPVKGWDLMVLECNQPCEDRHAIDLVNSGDIEEMVNSTPAGKVAEGAVSFWERWSMVRNRIVQDGKVHDRPGGKDLLLFSVLDGHSGSTTSDLLSKVLNPTLLYSLYKSNLIGNTKLSCRDQAGDLALLSVPDKSSSVACSIANT